MLSRAETTYRVEICLAGDVGVVRQACREHTLEAGLCVTVAPCDFVYTGGAEAGALVRLVNYPRFPSTGQELWGKAVRLGELLMRRCCQTSFLLVADDRTEWFSRRDELPEVK